MPRGNPASMHPTYGTRSRSRIPLRRRQLPPPDPPPQRPNVQSLPPSILPQRPDTPNALSIPLVTLQQRPDTPVGQSRPSVYPLQGMLSQPTGYLSHLPGGPRCKMVQSRPTNLPRQPPKPTQRPKRVRGAGAGMSLRRRVRQVAARPVRARSLHLRGSKSLSFPRPSWDLEPELGILWDASPEGNDKLTAKGNTVHNKFRLARDRHRELAVNDIRSIARSFEVFDAQLVELIALRSAHMLADQKLRLYKQRRARFATARSMPAQSIAESSQSVAPSSLSRSTSRSHIRHPEKRRSHTGRFLGGTRRSIDKDSTKGPTKGRVY